MRPQTPRRPVPLWQIAPFCLIPPVIVAAASFYVMVNPRMVLYTFIVSCSALLLIAAPHKQLRWALAAAVIILGIELALSGSDIGGLTVAAAHWVHASFGAGV